MVTTLADTDQLSFQCFKEALNNTFQPLAPTKDLEILRSGNGQGRLAGGNLTTLTHLLGTPWQPQLSGRILFLEDTGEPLYKLDRMLTHLACCGLLDNLAGLILGVFDPGQYDRLEILRLNEQVWSRALELTQGRRIRSGGLSPGAPARQCGLAYWHGSCYGQHKRNPELPAAELSGWVRGPCLFASSAGRCSVSYPIGYLLPTQKDF